MRMEIVPFNGGWFHGDESPMVEKNKHLKQTNSPKLTQFVMNLLPIGSTGMVYLPT